VTGTWWGILDARRGVLPLGARRGFGPFCIGAGAREERVVVDALDRVALVRAHVQDTAKGPQRKPLLLVGLDDALQRRDVDAVLQLRQHAADGHVAVGSQRVGEAFFVEAMA